MTEYNHLPIMLRELIGVKNLETQDAGFAFAQLLFSVGAWFLYYALMNSIVKKGSSETKKKKREHPGIRGLICYGIFVGVISFYFGVVYFVCTYKKGYEMLWIDWYLRYILTGFVLIFFSYFCSMFQCFHRMVLHVSFGIFFLCLLPYTITDSLFSIGKAVPLWVRKLTEVISYIALPGNCAYTRPLSRSKIICYVVFGVVFLCAIVIKWKQQTVKDEG